MRWRWLILGAIALLLTLAVTASFLVDEPLRERVEAGMNAALKGYTVHIRKLRFHPVGCSVDLIDWVIVQDANPEPPVANIRKLHASVHWGALLHGALVADFRFDRPSLYLDLRKARTEAQDPRPVKERGWQEAALAVYPLDINLLRIVDGDVTYVEAGPLAPLRVSGLQFRANNIRNVRSRAGTYPSEVHLAATIVDTAKLQVDGNADFLAEPTAGLKADFDLRDLRLDYLEPILHHYDVAVRRGTLSARGEVEYAASTKTARVTEAKLARADLAYVKRRSEQPGVGEKAATTAAAVTQRPTVAVRVDRADIADSTLAYTNETTDPAYRLFMSDCNATLTDFSNVTGAPDASPGTAKVSAKFMGSGDTHADASFRPRRNRTDFDVSLRIADADMSAMNDLWRAYGKFDVKRGIFSLYSEIKVEQGQVDGYVKPIFREIKIFDPDQKKGLGQKIYEGVVGGVATALTNPPRDQVATKTDLSGPLDDPHTSVLQIAGNLVRNAFFKAILPGLERWRGRDE